MTDEIERMARQIWMLGKLNMADAREAARAALTALRKPSERMVEAGSLMIVMGKDAARRSAERTFTAMINTALGEPRD